MNAYEQFSFGLAAGLVAGGFLGAIFTSLIFYARNAKLRAQHQMELVELETRAKSAEQELHIRIAHFESSRQELSAAFSELSIQALQRNNELFIDLAEQSLSAKLQQSEGELGKHRESVAAMSEQIRQGLDRVSEKIVCAEKERAEGQGDLTRHLKLLAENAERLGRETTRLSTSLRATRVQGSWGEAQLRNIIEGLGLLPHCDFTEQSVHGDGLRPDVIISLPYHRKLILDAKAPISTLLTEGEIDGKALCDALRGHVKQLSSRKYPEAVEGALEFTMLFLPTESICSVALEYDPSIYTFALERKVLLVTPLSVAGFLTLISSSWRALKIDENAQEMVALGRDVCKRVEVFIEHFNKLGRSITSTVKDYNAALGSFDTRLLPSLQRLHDVAGDSAAVPPSLAAPIFIEASTRFP